MHSAMCKPPRWSQRDVVMNEILQMETKCQTQRNPIERLMTNFASKKINPRQKYRNNHVWRTRQVTGVIVSLTSDASIFNFCGIVMTSSNGNIFRGDRCIPLTKASDTELWVFICAWTNRDSGDWDTIAPIMTSLWWYHGSNSGQMQ